jgi:hypothetical protein
MTTYEELAETTIEEGHAEDDVGLRRGGERRLQADAGAYGRDITCGEADLAFPVSLVNEFTSGRRLTSESRKVVAAVAERPFVWNVRRCGDGWGRGTGTGTGTGRRTGMRERENERLGKHAPSGPALPSCLRGGLDGATG